MKKSVKTSLIAAALLAAPAAHAGSLYVFGDSLADNGNIPRLYGVPFSIIEGAKAVYYDNGRFSNGPVWAEYLPGLTGLSYQSSNDFAVGGALTGPVTIGGKTYNNLVNEEGLPIPLPNFQQEIARFAAGGGHFGRSDIAGIWVGANNYFLLSPPADPAANGAVIAAATSNAVAQTQAGLGQLISLGARTLVVQNLPALGETPSYNTGSADAIAFGNALSVAHNAALSKAVAALHAQTGANIVLVNEALIFQEALANPAAYGLTNVTQACVATPSCATASQAQQNKYLFWDSVHPTTGTHDIVADYSADALNGMRGLAVPAQLTALGTENFVDALDGRVADLRHGASGFAVNLPQQGMVAELGANDAGAGGEQRLAGFVTGSYNFGSRKTNYSFNGFNYNNGTVTGGLDYRLADGIAVGGAFGYGTDNATINEGGSVNVDAYQLGLYAGIARPQYYANAVFGYGFDDYDNKRPGVVDQLTAKPSGNSYDFTINTGYTLHFGQVAAGPVAGISIAHVTLGSYTENGDPALTQTVDSQAYKRDILEFGGAAETTLQLGTATLAPQLRAAVEDLLSGNGGIITSSFTDEPLVLLSNNYATTARYWGDISAGIAGSINSRLSVAAKVETTVAKTDGNEHAVSLNVRYVF